MDNRDTPKLVATLVNAIEAAFDAWTAAYLGVLRAMTYLMIWTAIIGFGAIFVVNTIGFEMDAPGARLDISVDALIAAFMFYTFRFLVRFIDVRR